MEKSHSTLLNTPSHLMTLSSIGSTDTGFISVAEFNKNIPFEIKRVYWIYYTPQNVIRCNHAHRQLQQLLIATSGVLHVDVEDLRGNKNTFILDNPACGLYIAPFSWRIIRFSHNAVLLCLASMEYQESDYIRDYKEFKYLQESSNSAK